MILCVIVYTFICEEGKGSLQIKEYFGGFPSAAET